MTLSTVGGIGHWAPEEEVNASYLYMIFYLVTVISYVFVLE